MMPVIRTGRPGQEQGSIIVVVATDAPLLPHQLERLAHRVPLGIGRVGGYGGNSSGDIFIAFSTANRGAFRRTGKSSPVMLSNDLIDPLFEATVEATEESILNVLVAAETTTGIDGNTVYALPTSVCVRC
jgi:L-aminopeptidase/D-esterase-like protein